MKKKHFFSATARKRFLVVFLLLLQIGSFAYILLSGSFLSTTAWVALNVVSVVVALFVVTKKGESAYKLTWIFFILSFPIFGAFMYLILASSITRKALAARVAEATKETHAYLRSFVAEEGRACTRKEVVYLSDSVGFPACCNTEACFLPSGESMFEKLKEALEQAEKYIFLEFFIVGEGEMWQEILAILKRKAAEGVTVRLIYDDVGSFVILPSKYPKKLKKYGIDAVAFNPFVPILKLEQNNRDHRKIAVVDGKIAITGGINLADEYINLYEKYGHWNDAAVLVKGKAAWALALLFLQMWAVCRKKKEDVMCFLPQQDVLPEMKYEGLVLPYADNPLDDENVGERVYWQMIANAQKYVYITTPYLVIDDKMTAALVIAAKSGVDVRIVVPHHWDKRIVHMTTRTYYRELIEAGVQVYEYTPGFMHAKTVVSDDVIATVGSTNFDFRSLYLHFECGVLFYGHPEIKAIKENFLRITSVSEKQACPTGKFGFWKRLWYSILRLLSPLM